MPIFEFVCGQCGRTFEELMTFAQMEAGEAACPGCGSSQVQRNLSSFATGTGGGGGTAPVGGCGSGGFT
ncbi:zinc ribbon domain-containing protein [bacterium]|nr:zinc ribbon domain-containing protein [bacterium]